MSDLNKLPFVDGIPGEGQERINWVKNGERLLGAENEFGNQGSLNRAGVQLNKNIEVLYDNQKAAEFVQKETTEQVQLIKDILDQATDENLIEQVKNNSTDIESLKLADANQTEVSEEIDERLIRAESAIGSRTTAGGDASIFDDLLMIKTTVGNETGFDINGKESPGTSSSGIIKKLDDVRIQSIDNRDKITQIQNQLEDSDIDDMANKLAEIRSELGTKPTASPNTVYTRLATNEGELETIEVRLEGIEESIGTGKIHEKVAANTQKIGELDTQINGSGGLEAQHDLLFKDVHDPVTGLTKKVADNNSEIAQVKALVGATPDVGMRKEISDLQTSLGQGTNPPESSVRGRVRTLETSNATNTSKIQDIEIQLGTSTTGLIGDNAANKRAIEGNSGATDPVEQAGLMASTKAIRTGLIDTNGAVTELINKFSYTGKTFTAMSDATFKGFVPTLASKINATDSTKSINSVGGVDAILNDNGFAEAIKGNVILINCGTYDYLFDSDLGSLENATPDYSGQPNFYNSLFKLLDATVTATSTSRVFITTGFRPGAYTGTTVVYPAVNAKGHAFNEYAEAIKEVAAIFAIPVIDTNDELGIIEKNVKAFTKNDGLNAAGLTRFVNLAAGSINSK